ncbi:MAG: trigger factor [Elusimicrobiota bacterium]|jgi:trigger factor|nr:trigger factor [Elusimicrobiota bacterium]
MSTLDVASDNEVSQKELGRQGCGVTLEVVASKELVNKCFQNALVQVQSRAQLQGFRAGRAPAEMVKKNFPAQIAERAVDFVIRNAAAKALDKSKLRAVMLPVVSKADFTAVAENKPFTFEIKVDVAPEFDPKDYIGIEVDKKSEEVSAADMQKHLEEILDHNASLEAEGEGAAVGGDSYVIVSYKGVKDGAADKKYSAEGELVDMAAPHTIAGLSDAVKGLKKGESKDFEAETGDGVVKFSVKVDEIKKKIKPALDDAFAKNMGFDSVEKLKETVKSSMEKEAKLNAEKAFTAQIEDALVKSNTFEIPQSLVDYHTAAAVENFIKRMFPAGQKAEFTDENKKAFAARMRPSVEKDLRIGYIMRAIAEKENLRAADADWQAELDKAIAANPKEEKRVRDFFNEKKHDILASLDEKKTLDFLKANAKAKQS